MKSATQVEIKKELDNLSPKQLKELCLRLSRFKKENKELITYLLFEAENEELFVEQLKAEIEVEFNSINDSNLYLVKKSLRKILRSINKYCRYTNNESTPIDLHLFYCEKLKERHWNRSESVSISKINESQLKKISQALDRLDPDLQADYAPRLEALL